VKILRRKNNMKILMIGLGSIGQRHLRNIRRIYGNSVDVIAYRVRKLDRTFSDDMKIRENVILEEEFNVKTFDNLKEALQEKPDIAFITNITSLHVSTAIECAKAGCHLFIEKPLSYNLNQIEELKKVVQDNKLVTFMGFQNRYNPCIKELKKILETKVLGNLIAVNVDMGERLTTMHTYEDYKETYMARKDMGGGVILNQSIHEIDYLTYLFGAVDSVYACASCKNSLNIDVDDNSSAIYDFNGLPVFVHSDFMQFPPTRKTKVIGSKGYVEIDLINNKLTKALNDTVEVVEYKDFSRNDMFIEELKLFIEAVNNNDYNNNSSIEDGIKTLKIALATIESINKKTKIQL